MSAFHLGDPLDFVTITNLFLYGQPTTPQNYCDRIRADSPPIVTVEIDAASFMSAAGPGRYALPSLAPFVKTFFQDIGAMPGAVQAYVTQKMTEQGDSGPVKVTVG